MSYGNQPNGGVFIPWNQLRAWIDEQEALEKEELQSSLTRVQLQALSHLIQLGEPEPEVGARDYISQLMLHYAKSGQEPPKFMDDPPIEVPLEGKFANKWRTYCILGPRKMKFPRVGYGLDNEGQLPPLFSQKKMAKQYAAKYAYEYLNGQPTAEDSPSPPSSSTSSSKGASLSSSRKAAPSPPKREKADATLPANAPGALASPPNTPSKGRRVSGGTGSSTASAKEAAFSLSRPSTERTSPAINTSNQFDPPPTALMMESINVLSAKLGIGNIIFTVTETEESSGFFDVVPQFKDSPLVPDGVGVVRQILGKNRAKGLSAKLVLEYLQEELEQRNMAFEDTSGRSTLKSEEEYDS